jgi:type VI protein secretion system component VasF
MKLTELCEPLFQYICLLNRSARKGAAYDRDQVRGELEVMFADMASKAASDSNLHQQYEMVEAPLLFFADATVRESSLPFANDWRDMAHERADLIDADGGAAFFDLLDDTLRDQSYVAADRLAIFYTCMGLGFTGWYAGQPEFLRKRMLEIATRTRSPTEVDSASRIVPEAYEHVNTSNLIDPPGTSLMGIGIVLVGLIVVLFAANAYFYRSNSQSLNDSIGNIIETGKSRAESPESAPRSGAAADKSVQSRGSGLTSDAG